MTVCPLTVRDMPAEDQCSLAIGTDDGHPGPGDPGVSRSHDISAQPTKDGVGAPGRCDGGRINRIPARPGTKDAGRRSEPADEIADRSRTCPKAQPPH